MPYIRVNSLKTELNQHSIYFDPEPLTTSIGQFIY